MKKHLIAVLWMLINSQLILASDKLTTNLSMNEEPQTAAQKEKINNPNNLVEKARFEEGLAIIHRNGRYGFVDEAGKTVIPTAYDDAEEFNNGYAYVAQNGLWGVIDRSGAWVIQPQYYKLRHFSANAVAARTKKTDDWRLIRFDGKFSSEQEYSNFFPLTENCWKTIVTLPRGVNKRGWRYDTREGLVDSFGTILLEPKYYSVTSLYKRDGSSRLNGNSGRFVLIRDADTDLYGLASVTGKTVLDTDYEHIDSLLDDTLFKIYEKTGRRVGISDDNGKIVVQPLYKKVSVINERLFLLATNSDQYEIATKAGNKIPLDGMIEEPRYYEGFLYVVGSNRKHGLLDAEGNIVTEPQYDFIGRAANEKFVVTKAEKAGLMDAKGKLIVPIIYDDMYPTSLGFVGIKDGKKHYVETPFSKIGF